MPFASIRNLSIHYEIIGSDGPWITLSPGGRRALDEVIPLAEHLAAAGYRVLLHDRRNCGSSDVGFEGEGAEYEIWADDLRALMQHLGIERAIVGGGSSGCRLSLLFAQKYPQCVRALLLWRVTGGAFAANRLAQKYYGEYAKAAAAGGMQAVCETEHFADSIKANPGNRERLLQISSDRFIAIMTEWQRNLEAGASQPVLGTTAAQLAGMRFPTIIVPGNDRTHPHAPAEAAAALIADAEIFDLYPGDQDRDIIPAEEWSDTVPQMAQAFIDFLRRRVPAEESVSATA